MRHIDGGGCNPRTVKALGRQLGNLHTSICKQTFSWLRKCAQVLGSAAHCGSVVYRARTVRWRVSVYCDRVCGRRTQHAHGGLCAAGSLGAHATQRNASCVAIARSATKVIDPMSPLWHRFLVLTLCVIHNDLVDRVHLAHLNTQAPRAAAAASGPRSGHDPCCKRPASFAEEPVRNQPAKGV